MTQSAARAGDPPASEQSSSPREMLKPITFLSISLIFLLVCSTWFLFGSEVIALILTRASHEILVFKDTHSLGTVNEGSNYDISVPLTNQSQRAIRVIGAQTSCSCTALDGLPFVLGPGEVRNLNIKLRTAGRHGRIDENVRLFTDQREPPVYSIHVSADVVALETTQPQTH